MSKHFMLLRKVGREQDLFQTPDRPPVLRDAIESTRAGTRSAGNRSDLETLRYREQLKLVLRIFAVNTQSTPHPVLFSSLESEAAACSITARTAEILAA